MKDLNLLKSEKIKCITIYNIFWIPYRKIWNNNKIIKLDINHLYHFNIEKTNSHKYFYVLIKKYLEENYSDEKNYFIDDFSYFVDDCNGVNYISLETKIKDHKTLKIKK